MTESFKNYCLCLVASGALVGYVAVLCAGGFNTVDFIFSFVDELVTKSLESFFLCFRALCASVLDVTVFGAGRFNTVGFNPLMFAYFVFDGDYNCFFFNGSIVVAFYYIKLNFGFNIIAVFECYCCENCASCNAILIGKRECYNTVCFVIVERLYLEG